MPPHPDWSQFVTRPELATALAPLAEIRGRLWTDLDRLHAGQEHMHTELRALVIQVTAANGRTGEIEATLQGACERLGEIGQIAQAAQAEATAGHADALWVKEHGCAKLESHEDAVVQLVEAGVLPEGRVLAMDESRFPRLRKHAPKAAVGGGLVALGALLPHLLEWVKWLVGLFQ